MFGIDGSGESTIELMDEQNTPISPEDFPEIVAHYCALNPFTIKMNVKKENKVVVVDSQVSRMRGDSSLHVH